MAPKVGDRIKFRPTHQKDLELTGKVKAVNGKEAVVLSEAGNGSVSRVYHVHTDDCTPITEEKPAPADQDPEDQDPEDQGQGDDPGSIAGE